MQIGDRVVIQNKEYFLKKYKVKRLEQLDSVYPPGWSICMNDLLGKPVTIREISFDRFYTLEGYYFLNSDAILLTPTKKGNIFQI